MNATMSLESTKHYPVMLDQILSIISPQHGGTFIDCTFGAGGYSKAILKHPNTKVFALDRDKNSKKYADILSKKFPNRFSFCVNKFSNISNIFKSNLNPKAIIFDLGISSLQLSDNERGFSFQSSNTLNMEMGINKSTAYKVINNLEKEDLANIIKVLGDEKDGKKIANKIIKQRAKKPIETTNELVSIINKTKKNFQKFKKNPSTKTFQAIRIFVNQELTELILGLIEATKLLTNGGMLIVVSFHSLEDRIVKNFFNLYSNSKENPSRYLPEENSKSELFKSPSKKPLLPSLKEVEENVRSRSAKMRYAVRNDIKFFYPEEFKNKFSNYLRIEGLRI